MRRTILCSLLLLLLSAGAARAEDEVRARFWEARLVMQRGDPESAAELFRVLRREHPEAEVADDCLYWMARCYLRVKDHEPDAVVALHRLIEDHPASPYVDDAARELARLDDRAVVGVLRARLPKPGEEARLAALALAELGEEAGTLWLREHQEGEARIPVDLPRAKRPTDLRAEVAELRAEVKRLTKEVEEAIRLLTDLLAK